MTVACKRWQRTPYGCCNVHVRGGSPERLQHGLWQHLGQLEHARHVIATVGEVVQVETGRRQKCRLSIGREPAERGRASACLSVCSLVCGSASASLSTPAMSVPSLVSEFLSRLRRDSEAEASQGDDECVRHAGARWLT